MNITPNTTLAVAQALITLRDENKALKAEVEELRYIVKQFKEWRGDDDTGCPKYQEKNYPCEGEKEFREKFGEDADFDTIECDDWGEGCWVEYYRWKYRQAKEQSKRPRSLPPLRERLPL